MKGEAFYQLINKHMKKITTSEAEIILAEVIDTLYLQYKTDFCGEGRPHRLGFFKEKVKAAFHCELIK